MTAAEMRAWRGPALFEFGFRPFFLFGAAWAGLDAPLWAALYVTGHATILGASGLDWHIHEMLFGYLAAVMAGFLTTAVPNWTGRLPVVGWPLAALFGLWAAGRVAMLLAGPLGATAAVVDSLFLAVFAMVIWREVIAGRNWRNLVVCMLVSLFALANIGVHLRGAAPFVADLAQRLALGAPAMLIALIGGRITPSFTRNWLQQRRVASLPAPTSRFDQLVLVLTAAGLLAWIAFPTAAIAGVLLAAAGVGNGIRLARWRGWTAMTEPLVWILHVGYAWLCAGLALLAASVLAPDSVPTSAALHALTAGAFGVMTLAVMTRASLGHTGRARTADAPTTAIYLAAIGAAVVRVVASFAIAMQSILLPLAGALWGLAFLGFAAAYGPMLWSQRAAGPAGGAG